MCNRGDERRRFSNKTSQTCTIAAFILALLSAASPGVAAAAEVHLFSRAIGAAGTSPSNPYPLVNPTQVAVDESTGDVYVANPSRNDEQKIMINATGGSISLTVEDPSTKENKTVGPIETTNASFPDRKIQEGLDAVLGRESTYVRELNDTHTELIYGVEFRSSLSGADIPAMSCDGSALTGPSASCATAVTSHGERADDIEKFDAAGNLVWTLGDDVDKSTGGDLCTTASHDECQPGVSGSSPGAFVEPRYITVDNSDSSSKGDIYVGDYGGGLISKFTSEGQLVRSWGNAGEHEAPTGQLNVESSGVYGNKLFDGMTVNPSSGELYVGVAFYVLEFSSAGTISRELVTNLGDGNANLAASAVGDLYADNSDSRPLFTQYEEEIKSSRPAFKFNAKTQVNPTELDPGPVDGIGVDPVDGNVYVAKGASISAYSVSGDPLEPFIGFDEGVDVADGVAVGPAHVLYAVDPIAKDVALFTIQEAELPVVGFGSVGTVGYTSGDVSGSVDPEGHPTVCDFEYVSETHFQQYGFGSGGVEPVGHASCTPEPVGSGSSSVAVQAKIGQLTPGTTYRVRLAARNAAGTAYSAEPYASFETKPVAAPIVVLDSVGSITATTADFVGHVDPNAPEPLTAEIEEAYAVSWRFQCTPECPDLGGGDIVGSTPAGSSSQEVSATARLLPGTSYQVTLKAQNAGAQVATGPVSFTTPAVAPRVDSTFPTSVASTTANLNALVDPGGASTTVRFQYITEKEFVGDGEQFGAGTQTSGETGSVGSDDNDHEASVAIAGLEANTAYEIRAVAANRVATETGPAALLYSYPREQAHECVNEQLRLEDRSLVLPDCRAYELVSSPTSLSDVYVPTQGGQKAEQRTVQTSDLASRASTSGEGVVFVADPPAHGGNGAAGRGLGDQYVANRAVDGWTSQVITPAATYAADNQPGYEAFSPDLSDGIIYPFGEAAGGIPSLASRAPAGCRVLYLHTGAEPETGFQPLFEETQEDGNCGYPFFAGANSGSPTATEFSRLAFQTEAALLPGVRPAENPVPRQERCLRGCDLYERTPGGLELVDVLPSGQQASGATFGGPGSNRERPNFGHVLSPSGSQAFWTDDSTGKIYVREGIGSGEAKTIQVSAGRAQYWTATNDGRYAYYVENGALLRFDVSGALGHQRETLESGGAQVQGVIGVNEEGEDGAYVYFVADSKLSANAGEGDNLYLLHTGQLTFIATLSPQDNTLAEAGTRAADGDVVGDWNPDLGSRTAELTPDGHSLVFQSLENLTGVAGGGVSVFDYEADLGRLACVSCEPSGVPPKVEVAPEERATSLPVSFQSTYMRRWMSDNGSRVFFETEQALVPEDTNGLQDVYEWVREGASGCPEASPPRPDGGCVHLLSGGGGASDSLFVEASASGDDVFFVTRDELVDAATGDQLRLFDARVDGGFPAGTGLVVQPPACEGVETCNPPTSEPPVESFPASTVFAGAGNLIPPLSPSPPTKRIAPKKKIKCPKGKRLERNKCTKQKTKKKAKKDRRKRGAKS